MNKKNNILVVGSGGREHALVYKISQSKKVNHIYCAPGNPGTSQYAKNVDIKSDDLKKLLEFSLREKIDYTIVGPEAPLINGIKNLFEENKLNLIGPSKEAARIEGSKVFSKNLLKKYKIPTAKFFVFENYAEADKFLSKQEYPLVVKADGQCLGKGVKVCRDKISAQKFLSKIMVEKIFGKEGRRVIIEECLSGQEISITVATDGKNFKILLPSQDHKRIFDNDTGPNTGGMGAYAPVPFLKKDCWRKLKNRL